MRRIIVCFLVLTAAAGFGQTAYKKAIDGPVLAWEDSNFEFGDLQQGDKVEHTFKFTNAGSEPLIITNVSTQCGCTTPKGWPRDPVMPGDQGEITISFSSAGKIGRQNKVATVLSNAANNKANQLMMSGNVVEKKTP